MLWALSINSYTAWYGGPYTYMSRLWFCNEHKLEIHHGQICVLWDSTMVYRRQFGQAKYMYKVLMAYAILRGIWSGHEHDI